MPYRPKSRLISVLAALGALLLTGATVHAADLDYVVPAPPMVESADCAAAPTLPWESVWLGHFSGGESHYDREAGQIAVAWVDQKLCFPSQEACKDWVQPLRRAFHRPESYFTCLRLR